MRKIVKDVGREYRENIDRYGQNIRDEQTKTY